MCGLAGLIDTSRNTRAAELCATARSMADCLRHRGPDDSGTWSDEAAGVALGFRRLAIIDLSDAGHQPMISHDGRLVMVFNGEIYNHQDLRRGLSPNGTTAWAGHSDTETLLECFSAWGVKQTLQQAAGMFALALWDRLERRLYLARDRFGEKPLYYGWTRRSFVFGSELRPLTRSPGFEAVIDRDVLSLFMEDACVPAPYSIYRNTYKLEPGCVLSLSLEGASAAPPTAPFAPARHTGLLIDRYWSFETVVNAGQADLLVDEQDALEQVETTLGNAIRLQSVADVPLGAFLSGGIDSSLIVALMRAHSSRVKSFTIGFEETGFNEAEHAKRIARHLQTDHEELYVSAQQTRDIIPLLPQLYSEPFADSSQIPTHIVSHMARRHVTVALSGDGGDELFGGYSRYLWGPLIWHAVSLVPRGMRARIGTAMAQLPIRHWDALGAAARGRLPITRLGDKAHKLASRLQHSNSLNDFYRALASVWPRDSHVVRGAQPLRTRLETVVENAAGTEPAHRMMLWDTLTYLPDDILHKVDRASMGVSLETRAPFLDHRVAELAWRLPLHMKIRNGTSKWILRQLLYRHVPKDLIDRPKMGFGIPLDAWLRGPLRDWAEHLLGESRLASSGYFHAAPIRQKWQEHLSGTRNWEHHLWCVLMFEAWLERARMESSAPLDSSALRRQ